MRFFCLNKSNAIQLSSSIATLRFALLILGGVNALPPSALKTPSYLAHAVVSVDINASARVRTARGRFITFTDTRASAQIDLDTPKCAGLSSGLRRELRSRFRHDLGRLLVWKSLMEFGPIPPYARVSGYYSIRLHQIDVVLPLPEIKYLSQFDSGVSSSP